MLSHVEESRKRFVENLKEAYEIFEKGGRGAVIGEIRKFGGRDYIKLQLVGNFMGRELVLRLNSMLRLLNLMAKKIRYCLLTICSNLPRFKKY